MNIEFETRCKVCNQKMEYLGHEKILMPVITEMSTIGVRRTIKSCNIRFYCGHCRVNMSKPFPYNDDKYIPRFIADVKNASAHFEKQEYIKL